MTASPCQRPLRRLAPLPPIVLALLAVCADVEPSRAQIWNELGDAGALPSSAQVTSGSGPLTTLNGNLGSSSDVDMYCIRVSNAPAFLARLQCTVVRGPHLWVFDATGKGVGAATTCQAGDKRVTSALVTTSGIYYVAVSFDGVDPYSGANLIWNHLYTTERAPDGPGAAGAVTTWSGTGFVQPLNPYTILLSGVTYCDSPVPARSPTWGRMKLIYH